ncbi:MAG TPA: 3-deoxy-8-phosphooctulonate synthase [Bacillota bacterium]|jgi:2-dehydro-3-deoxyphosphooctonate aldolase (KDO 8-P synthase)|nr:3-deoxy-8-phosphooctulonate synthase [Bacillota bacterium]HOL09848.1 3-deoxy-8-phosphooctulonate synthase [Bacillota bacterium]HPO97592.1 3-deoxy-8-phosphooctulonate synthase [Bacillota bacterium]
MKQLFGEQLLLIAGPCVIESPEHTWMMATELKKIAADAGVKLVFKASYDKANRSAVDSFRGPGLKAGLEILKKIKQELQLPVLSDVHCVSQIEAAAEVLDIIQIPAFLSRQTDLIVAAAQTKKIINVKKAQFSAPEDMKNVLEKVYSTGNRQVILTERGVSFGYHNLVVDMRSLPIMRSFGVPVVFDGTHSVQKPGGLGKATGGDRSFVPYLCRAAVATGVDGIFLEVHDNPDVAKSDGPNMIRLSDLSSLLKVLVAIDKTVKEHSNEN